MDNQTVVTAAALQLASPVTKTVTIATGGTISTVLDKSRHKNIAIFLPANWVTSVITLTGCDTENGTFNPIVFSDVSAVTIASVAASKVVVLSDLAKDAIAAVPFIKLVSTQTQITTDKVITIVLTR
jgi:hypothetical protein